MRTAIDTAFIPIGRIVWNGGIQACPDYYDALGGEFGEQLRSMLVFDALIYNEDRHFGNFGLLRNNHTGQSIAPAPIFDNGLSLMAFADKDDLVSPTLKPMPRCGQIPTRCPMRTSAKR